MSLRKYFSALFLSCFVLVGSIPGASATMQMMLGVSAAAPFNPQTQGTLVNWYDASTLGLTNGASVTAFPDSKTGNPNPLTAGSGCTYATSQQNGLGTILWSSGIGFNGGSTASTYPYTLVVVAKVSNFTAGKAMIAPLENNGGLGFYINNDATIYLAAADIAVIGSESTSTITSGAYHLMVATVDSSTYAFYIDGVPAGSGTHSVSLTSGRTFELGLQKATEQPFDGYMGEAQIYSSILSSGDLSALHTWAVAKWATP